MRKVRVNIFEDDPVNLKLFRAILSTRDYEVNTFDRAVVCPVYKFGTEECHRLKPCADLILTDNQMPGMTGIEMLLAQSLRGCRVDARNIAVTSADLDDSQRKIVRDLGCAVLDKPFRLKQILSWLDDCEGRIDLSAPLGIIRTNERYPANIEMVCATDQEEKTFKGTAMNYSVNGLCLKTDTLLGEGQSLVIKTDIPNGCRRASVCWVGTTESNMFLAGIACCR